MAANSIPILNFVFCPPLPGKPGPYEADGVSRFRVPQSEQKGDTSGYYALQILRNEHKIGKNSPQRLASERGIEKAISVYRKERSKVYAQFEPLVDYAELFSMAIKACTKEHACEFVEEQVHRILPEHREFMFTSLRSFSSQNTYNDFSDFVQECYQKALMEVHEPFLHECTLSAELIEKTALKFFGRLWEELPIVSKEYHENNLVFMHSYLSYGCKRSSWHPKQDIEKLIEQLDVYGPHLVIGKIGKAYYYDDPSLQPQKIEGRPIFYWKPMAVRKKDIARIHAVVIIGAEIDKRGRQLVYFLDPLDGSDPRDISSQKIYMMSYDSLKTSIYNLHGRQLLMENGKPVFFEQRQEENNYALYMPRSS